MGRYPCVLVLVCVFLHGTAQQVVVGLDGSTSPSHSDDSVQSDDIARACSVFCHGKILEVIQKSRLFTDCKSFVDSSLKMDPEDVWKTFTERGLDKLNTTEEILAAKDQIQSFFQDTMVGPGEELQNHEPVDWDMTGTFAANITNFWAKKFAKDLNNLWPVLSRRAKSKVSANQQRHTLIPLSRPFIVPGGRFRETYYWDALWIIHGLLVSGMFSTAAAMVDNFVDLIHQLGFVPNGSRIYYLNRSQPPMLSEMVRLVVTEGGAEGRAVLNQRTMDALELEHAFWMKDPHVVKIKTGNVVYNLNRYGANVTQPRAESFREDLSTVEESGASDVNKVYSHIAAAAESGWDFSSRWLSNASSLATIHTMDIVPVDLNVYMAKAEHNIAQLFDLWGNPTKSADYMELFDRRMRAIDELFWDESSHQWKDLLRQSATSFGRISSLYFSNFSPVWVHTNITRVKLAATALNSSGLIHEGGVATSLISSGQQWDFPNAWAPLLHVFIEGLSGKGDSQLDDFALALSQTWLQCVFTAFYESGAMHEKYDVRSVGSWGGGGEYEPQVGFGWTNGVTLRLLLKYQDVEMLLQPLKSGGLPVYQIVLIAVFSACVVAGVGYVIIQRRRNKSTIKLSDGSDDEQSFLS